MSSLISIGKDLAGGIWTGLQNAASGLYSKITNMCNNLWKKVKNFFGISSPSKLFRDTIGNNLALGLGEGFVGEMNQVGKDMQAAVPTKLEGPSIDMGGVAATGTASGNGTVVGLGNGPLITIQQMIVRSEEDIRAISQQLYNMMQQSSRAQGYFTTA